MWRSHHLLKTSGPDLPPSSPNLRENLHTRFIHLSGLFGQDLAQEIHIYRGVSRRAPSWTPLRRLDRPALEAGVGALHLRDLENPGAAVMHPTIALLRSVRTTLLAKADPEAARRAELGAPL